MSEKIPTFKPKPSSTPESPEEAMSWRSEPVIREASEVCTEKIAELEVLFTGFQSKYDLESLRSITFFATKEERRASPRAQALVDIAPISNLIKFLDDQPSVSREAFTHLQRRYRILNNTVLGSLQDAPDGIGEIVVHRKINDDGSIED